MLEPASIVDNGIRHDGRLADRPERVAPLDEFGPLSRRLRRFRLKEYQDAASAPLSVSSRLPGGRMYTHKALFGVSGTLHAGDRTIVFDQTHDVAILDEHRSMLPYRTRWLWGTFAQHTPDGLIGANFADRPELPDQEEESGIWPPGSVEPLADVTFTPRGGDETAPWRVASADGRLDMRARL